MKQTYTGGDPMMDILSGIPVKSNETGIMIITPVGTLRDYFAGQALAGYSVSIPEGGSIIPKQAASWCYGIADAMLAEHEKEAQP
jgi:hypothetical protein